MTIENPYDRDLDEFVMGINTRPLREQIGSLFKKILQSKQSIDSTFAQEEGQNEELPKIEV